MAEKRYQCVICSHEFTSEEPPLRCPKCLSTRGIEDVDSVPEASKSRGGLIAAVVALVVVVVAVAVFFVVTKSDGGGESAGPEVNPGSPSTAPVAGSDRALANPGAVDMETAPDPSATGDATRAYVKEALGDAASASVSEKVKAVQAFLVARVKGGKLELRDPDKTFRREPLTADAVAAALSKGAAPPLMSFEAASFVVALGRALGLKAELVEDVDAPNSAVSLARKHFVARIEGTDVDPFTPDGLATADGHREVVPAVLVRAWFQGMKALSVTERENFKAANEDVARGLKLVPGDAALVFLKGQISVLRGMVDFGIEDLERALASKEDSLGRYNLGVAYVQAQRFFKAHEALRRSIELDPKFAGAWLALASLHLARLSITPESEREALIQSANEAVAKARAVDPDVEGLAVVAAQVQLAVQDSRGAFTILDDAVRAHPDRPQPFVLLGSMLAEDGKWAELVSYMKTGFEHNPGNKQIRGLLIMAYLQQGRSGEAEKLLTKAIAADPDQPDLRVELAGLLAERGETGGAQRLLEEELKRNPDSDHAGLLLAQLELQAGKTDEAVKRLDEVLERQPAMFEALALRYLVAYEKGDKAERASLLKRIATAQPNGRTLLANMLLSEGQVEVSVEVLESVLKDRPGSPQESIMLVAAYTVTGRLDDAKRVRDAAMARAGDSAEELAKQFDAAVSAAKDAIARQREAKEAASQPPAEPTPSAAPAPGAAAAPSTGGPSVEMPTVEMPTIHMPGVPGEDKAPGGLHAPSLDLPEMPKAP